MKDFHLVRAFRLAIALVGLAAGVLRAPAQPVPGRLPPGDYVTVNGTRLWYLSEGKGEPLILISGGPGAAHYLYPYFSALADSYRVIYLDSFGCGKSDRAKSPQEYTFARHVEEIEGFRLALGLGKINVLGHSYGSMVAQAYALRFPDSVQRLVLSNAYLCGEEWQAGNDNVNDAIRNQYPEVWAQLQTLRARGLRSSAKECGAAMQAVSVGLLYNANISDVGKVKGKMNLDVYYAIAGDDADFVVGGDIARLDFRPTLKDLKMPMLVLAGRFDRVAPPRYTLQYRQYAPQAQFLMFEQSAHNLFLEENGRMLQTLRAFLADKPLESK